ncbi:hypothetical protein MBLNU459_g3894t1 [Dothideomycetes sp. NU459]
MAALASSRSKLSRLADELGITSLMASPRDVWLILLTRTVRMCAYGSSTLILALFLSAQGHSDAQIGLFMTLTLAGDVLVSLALTFVADALGRRRILLLGALLMVFSGAAFATAGASYAVLLFAAVVGVVSPSGNEIGPFRAVEESTLAHLVPADARADVFAWYVVFGTLGTSGGALACGWGVQRLVQGGMAEVDAYAAVFWVYALLGAVKAGVTLLLSARCEIEPQKTKAPTEEGEDEEAEGFLAQEDGSGAAQSQPRQPQPRPKEQQKKKTWAMAQISPESRRTLLKLCALFSVDSLASGMVPMSLISYYMHTKFGMPQSTLGTIVSAASFTSSVGNIFASSISKRIGFINTMVFTHLPSAVFLAMVPAPHSLGLTIAFLVLRSTLASMDQAPRSAFLSAVVLPTERTAVMGVVNTVKTMAQSGGPVVTGVLAGEGRFWIAFVAAGALKASYDLGLLAIFSNTKLRGSADEQRDRAAARAAQGDAGHQQDEVELQAPARPAR